MKERFLVDVDMERVDRMSADVLVIGAGAAGLYAAMSASREGASVVVLSKSELTDSNTAYAQGGVAASLGLDDSPMLHLSDTTEAGAGLADESAARKLVIEGPDCVQTLIEWGARFDRTAEGAIAFTREAAHSRNRILHADGDSTGREIARALAERAKSDSDITLLTGYFVVDFLHHENCVHGVLALFRPQSIGPWRMVSIEASATVLATGGAGRLYRETTNPEPATGDGLGVAYRAGAELADMEFVQFHPTTLYVAGAPRLLISEAVRGEGAHLLNTARERFMDGYHPQAELAPRDIVSAAIVEEMQETDSPHVYLDLRHLDPATVRSRFPTIADTCAMYGLLITRDLVPVRPSAHYMMGGVKTDIDAQTSLEGLWAAGEVACTGVHGANRLASNSLLEALVFGGAAGRMAASSKGVGAFPLKRTASAIKKREIKVDVDDVELSLQSMMTRQVGIFRDGSGLASAFRVLGYWHDYVDSTEFAEPKGLKLQDMLVAATLITRGALMRTESRGGHRRIDYPEPNDAEWKKRIVQSRTDFAG
jgi:L-aspartate oxidase